MPVTLIRRSPMMAAMLRYEAVGLLVNLSALYSRVEWGQLHAFVARILASMSAFAWNFSARYLWIFERGRMAEPARSGSVE